MIEALILRILGASVGGFITSKLGIVAVAGVLLLVSNLASSGLFYLKGWNSRGEQCQTASLKREIAEKTRDLGNAKLTAEILNQRLSESNQKIAEREQKVAEYESKLQTIPGCVVSDDGKPARSVRKRRAQQ